MFTHRQFLLTVPFYSHHMQRFNMSTISFYTFAVFVKTIRSWLAFLEVYVSLCDGNNDLYVEINRIHTKAKI